MEATQTLGKFSLVRHIATGGMAEIWLAEQVGPGGFAKELVIKRILPHLAEDSQFTTMFLDEARLVAQLTHPKIAQIYELGELEGQYFIAMEYVAGVDIAGILELARAKGQMIPIGVVVKLIIDTLEALDYAHDFTSRDGQPFLLVHRDVTPHNIIVSNDGIVKLVDFGVAKAKQNQSKTQTGAVKGKFAYMAPEQIQNKDLDRRVDIFATGVVLYEMLTLQKPFGDDLEAISNILSNDPRDPRIARPELPDALVAVINGALAKIPDERYHDAHSMMLELQNYLRTTAHFVGDREVSSYIRELQGLPTVRHTSGVGLASSQARVTPMELNATPIPELRGSSTISTPPPMANVITPPMANAVSPLMMTADIGSLGAVDRSNYGSDTEDMGPAKKSNTPLILLSLVLLLALAGGGVGLFIVATSGEPTKDPVVVVPTDPKIVVPKPPVKTVVPPAFNHAGGRIVYLKTTTPGAQVEFEGTVVGITPLDTNLRPGEYTVLLKKDARRESKTFKVTDKMINSIELKF